MDLSIRQFVVIIASGLCCLAMPLFFGTLVYLVTRQHRPPNNQRPPSNP